MARNDEVLKAIAVTAEIMSTQLSEHAARLFADDLRHYQITDIYDALTRCRKEIKGKLTVASVIERIEFALENKKKASAQGESRTCAYENAGQRCQYPGSTSTSTLGGGPYYCRVHINERGTPLAAQALQASRTYLEPRPPEDDLDGLTWLAENFPMQPGETRQEYNLRCREKALSGLKGFKPKPVVNYDAPVPVRMREPGEDLMVEF